MKAYFAILILVGTGIGFNTSGQNVSPSPEQQLADERYKRLNSSLEELWAARAAIDARIDALANEIRNLREGQNTPKANYATAEDFKMLADKIREIDKKREADKELILKEIEKLGKNLRPAVTRQPVKADRGFEHIVASGDTMSTIAAAFREQGVKVFADDIIKANPTVDPRTMQVGQKLWIPAP